MADPKTIGEALRKGFQTLAGSDAAVAQSAFSVEARICWLLQVAALDLDRHASIFAMPTGKRGSVWL
jgi:hypothetical protein